MSYLSSLLCFRILKITIFRWGLRPYSLYYASRTKEVLAAQKNNSFDLDWIRFDFVILFSIVVGKPFLLLIDQPFTDDDINDDDHADYAGHGGGGGSGGGGHDDDIRRRQ